MPGFSLSIIFSCIYFLSFFFFLTYIVQHRPSNLVTNFPYSRIHCDCPLNTLLKKCISQRNKHKYILTQCWTSAWLVHIYFLCLHLGGCIFSCLELKLTLNNVGVRGPNLCAVKHPRIGWPSTYSDSQSWSWLLNSLGLNHVSIEKNPHISGPRSSNPYYSRVNWIAIDVMCD